MLPEFRMAKTRGESGGVARPHSPRQCDDAAGALLLRARHSAEKERSGRISRSVGLLAP